MKTPSFKVRAAVASDLPEIVRMLAGDPLGSQRDKKRPEALRFYESLGSTASHEGMKLKLEKWPGNVK
jgi:hypothetical protein